MLLAGDEFGRTQHGNNNTYCQDNELNWVAWEQIGPDDRALTQFVRKLIALRQTYPILRRGRFLTGAYNPELDIKDVTWLTPAATEMTPEQWQDGQARCMGMLMDGRAQPTGIKKRGSDATLLLVFNAYHDVVPFTLPEVIGGTEWTCLIDTNRPELTEIPDLATGHEYEVTGRSLLLFALTPKGRAETQVREGVGTILDIAEAPPPMPALKG
jgi:glycogen operon protein